jgi:hypothetical protein
MPCGLVDRVLSPDVNKDPLNMLEFINQVTYIYSLVACIMYHALKFLHVIRVYYLF